MERCSKSFLRYRNVLHLLCPLKHPLLLLIWCGGGWFRKVTNMRYGSLHLKWKVSWSHNSRTINAETLVRSHTCSTYPYPPSTHHFSTSYLFENIQTDINSSEWQNYRALKWMWTEIPIFCQRFLNCPHLSLSVLVSISSTEKLYNNGNQTHVKGTASHEKLRSLSSGNKWIGRKNRVHLSFGGHSRPDIKQRTFQSRTFCPIHLKQ